MHGVLEHIDRHLDESLELATLAEVAHFSSFHFHRLFSAWMGETLGDYLRRRRLEVAADVDLGGIERDAGLISLTPAAEHIVVLEIVTTTDAAVAKNASLVVHRNHE